MLRIPCGIAVFPEISSTFVRERVRDLPAAKLLKIREVPSFSRHFYRIFLQITLPVVLAATMLTPRVSAQSSGDLRTVIIDPGHGGKDPGTRGKSITEKEVVLKVGLLLGDLIRQEFPDVNVLFTRDSDVFIPLIERTERAIAAKADLFISIHCNSAPNSAVTGIETYVMGLHKTESNLEVAQRENAVIAYEDDYTTKYEGYDPKSPESFIIFSLIQNVFLDQSLEFATLLQDDFARRLKRNNRGVRQAGFLVLHKSSMPSVLIELGFLSNPTEEAFLASSQGQEYLASAIFRAFKLYKQARDTRSIATPSLSVDTTRVSSKPEPQKTTVDSGSKGKAPKTPQRPKPTPPPAPTLAYRVQIATVNRAIEPNHPLRREFATLIEEVDGSVIRYYSAEYTTIPDAQQALNALPAKHKGAFIVVYEGGKRKGPLKK